jgi:tetratricopeptide (TPR) repeat protein/transcriptional regulator with XRE-family HTH domain
MVSKMIVTSNNMSSFGALLKAFRKRRLLTQQQLAEAIGIHRSAIIRWEQGDFLPASKSIVLELARHLHLDDQEIRYFLEASFTALTHPLLVPLPQNPLFTGREELLETIHAHLHVDRVATLTRSYAVYGLGGIGKTQLALEYVYRYALEYSATFWIKAETVESIGSSVMQIADLLQIPERRETDQQHVVAAVQQWLLAHSQWLLIWDNLEDIELLSYLLPPGCHGACLITTRCQVLGPLIQGLELAPMEEEEGLLLLLRRAKLLGLEAMKDHLRHFAMKSPTDYTAAKKLVQAMGGLPLALDQAGAYIEETGCSVAGYLTRYAQQHHQLLARRGTRYGDHPHSVVNTLWLTCQRVAQQSPAALDLLRFCAFVSPEAIPEDLLMQGVTQLEPGPDARADPLKLDSLLAELRRFSLVQQSSQMDSLSIHRLVQVILLDALSENERRAWVQHVMEALDATFPTLEGETEDTVWNQCERLLPHALQCLCYAKAMEPNCALASLIGKTARYLQKRGQYTEAAPLFRRLWHIQEQILGPDHPQTASSLDSLARCYTVLGKQAEAESLLQQALHIYEQALGPDHPHMASPLCNLAILYREQGKYSEAESLLQRALQIDEQALGPDHLHVAYPLNNLANLYERLGKYAEAAPLFHRAIQINEQALGPEHTSVAIPLYNLALIYYRQGKYTEAEPRYQRAQHIWEQARGPEDSHVAIVLNSLGVLYVDQGKYAQAELLFHRAVHISEQTLGPEHPNVGLFLNELADLYHRQGKDKHAEQAYRRALHISEKVFGPDHPQVAESLMGLADLCRGQKNITEAEVLYQRALTICEGHLGPDHPEVTKILHRMALLQHQQGHLNAAISLAERAFAILTRTLGEAHPKTVATQTLFTQLRAEQEENERMASGSKKIAESMEPVIRIDESK